MELLPGVKQKRLVSTPFLVMLIFGGVGWLVGFSCMLALPQDSPGETPPSTQLVHIALGGWKKRN